MRTVSLFQRGAFEVRLREGLAFFPFRLLPEPLLSSSDLSIADISNGIAGTQRLSSALLRLNLQADS